ncbi:MAG: hypothetical protein U0936_04475 [Planctomycetaceae bacterium]
MIALAKPARPLADLNCCHHRMLWAWFPRRLGVLQTYRNGCPYACISADRAWNRRSAFARPSIWRKKSMPWRRFPGVTDALLVDAGLNLNGRG